MGTATIDDGTRAIIELAAERAATRAIEKHADGCSIGHLWTNHDRVKGRVRKLELLLALAAGSGALGGAAWALVRHLSG